MAPLSRGSQSRNQYASESASTPNDVHITCVSTFPTITVLKKDEEMLIIQGMLHKREVPIPEISAYLFLL